MPLQFMLTASMGSRDMVNQCKFSYYIIHMILTNRRENKQNSDKTNPKDSNTM